MKKTLLSAMFLAGCFAFASCGNNAETDSKEIAEEQNEAKMEDTPAEDMQKDADFAVNAADGGMMEVEASRLANTNATSGKVKQFAEMMVTDHSKANEELKAWAAGKNVSLPATLSDDKQQKLSKLSEKKGKDFDKEYMAMMVDDHEKAVNDFQKETEDGKDADLKSWAGTKLPTLQQHLQMAKETKDALK